MVDWGGSVGSGKRVKRLERGELECVRLIM